MLPNEEKNNITPMVLVLYSSIWKNPGRQKKCCHLIGKSWIHTQELQDYFDILLVPCNTSKSHKCLMEKQQKMRSAAAFRDQIYVAEHFFQVRFKGQKKVDRLNLLILPNLKAPFRGFLFLQEAPIRFWIVFCKNWNV